MASILKRLEKLHKLAIKARKADQKGDWSTLSKILKKELKQESKLQWKRLSKDYPVKSNLVQKSVLAAEAAAAKARGFLDNIETQQAITAQTDDQKRALSSNIRRMQQRIGEMISVMIEGTQAGIDMLSLADPQQLYKTLDIVHHRVHAFQMTREVNGKRMGSEAERENFWNTAYKKTNRRFGTNLSDSNRGAHTLWVFVNKNARGGGILEGYGTTQDWAGRGGNMFYFMIINKEFEKMALVLESFQEAKNVRVFLHRIAGWRNDHDLEDQKAEPDVIHFVKHVELFNGVTKWRKKVKVPIF